MIAMLVLVVVIAVLGLLAGVHPVAWLDETEVAARRPRIAHRVHDAEREITEIGRRNREAILIEALRRLHENPGK